MYFVFLEVQSNDVLSDLLSTCVLLFDINLPNSGVFK